MTDLKVVYTDKHESRPNGKDLAWVEYHALQWLNEKDNSITHSNALPQSLHIDPRQMRMDLLFSEDAQSMPKRLYMLAVRKSLTPSVMTTPMVGNRVDEKGLLVTIQGQPGKPEAMREFLLSNEVRQIIPEDAILLM